MEFLSKSQIKRLTEEYETDIDGLIYDNIIRKLYRFKAFYEYEDGIKKYTFYLRTDDIEVAYDECKFTWGTINFRELHPAVVKYQLI